MMMTKNVASALVIICGVLQLGAVANATESTVPEPFKGFDNSSKYAVNYDDLTDLLGMMVVDKGLSDRTFAKSAPEITGTRMKEKIRKTANEGNQFFYEAFKDNEAARNLLRSIQKSLTQLPDETPLEKFSREEQLAYWLNLYNVTVLNEIVAVYPKRNLRKLVRGRNSIFSRKLLTVAGVPLSLDDIQFKILKENYNNNPLIIYGLYQGIVGAPNIRTSAFSGTDVYFGLEANAYEFINSNRGTYAYDEDLFRVSSYYDRNKGYFPDFESDLPGHLLEYLQGSQRVRLQTASELKADINDWTVTDLGSTRQTNFGGSLANSQAAMLGAFVGQRKANGSIPTAAVIVHRKKEEPKTETVTVEDLGRLPGETPGARVEGISADQIEPMGQEPVEEEPTE